jgi:hypothetical protein
MRFAREVPAELERMVEKALRKDREERSKGPAEFIILHHWNSKISTGLPLGTDFGTSFLIGTWCKSRRLSVHLK